jgi:protein O-GlcNAc transferase
MKKRRPTHGETLQRVPGADSGAVAPLRDDVKPGLTPARALKRASALQQAGNAREAAAIYEWILARYPQHFDALHNLGILKAQGRRYEDALDLIRAALKINPRSAEANLNLGNALAESGQAEEALASYDKALAIKPRFAEALYGYGNALQKLKRHEEALASYDRALAILPDRAEVLANRGNTLHDLKRHEEALASYDRALAIMPGVALLHNNRGSTLRDLNRHEEALASLDQALAIEPDYVDALNNRGNTLQDLRRHEQALASFDLALVSDPDNAVAHGNRGSALQDLKRYEEAVASYERALALAPDSEYAAGMLANARMHCCDWRARDEEAEHLAADIRSGKRSVHPFLFLGISDSAQDQLLCSRIWVHDRCPAPPAPIWKGERYGHPRIRLAYLSADFHEHATAYLTAELFETHDRARFETTALSFGPDAPGEMRSRLMRAFDRFIDVRRTSDREVAGLLRELEIDIAVDLKGFTTDCRTRIFALRAVPVQVSYLGYPGTMGAGYIDYILADRFVIPEQHHPCYAEKVVYLPDTYQVNDSKRVIAGRMPTRAEAGLPEQGFVFCCFNNSYKINPMVFDGWMRLLRGIEGSALWLLEDNVAAMRNLRQAAERRGVAPERLVFAARVKMEEHLARHRLADLFLDTLPYNAHTTASDALWTGLPVLTCMGTTFAGRVAASLLNATGLHRLITHSLGEYEALALELATNRKLLTDIASKLAENRTTHPLFGTDRFRRHIEAAYTTMWERYQRGEPPESFAVEPIID